MPYIVDGRDSVNSSGAIDFGLLARLAGSRSPADVPCPLCGPDRKTKATQQKPTLRIWRVTPDFVTYTCARCTTKGWASDRSAKPVSPAELARRMAAAEAHHRAEAGRRTETARRLWERARPASGTIVVTYLRTRAIEVLPPTLRFLPARGEYAPAMVAAFGLPAEREEPGRYALANAAVTGIHVTRLKPDGAGKAADAEGREKIMIGPSMGCPLALVPPNDLGGLAIAEGIETALSLHQATGLGVWAAGSAGRLPALAPRIADLAGVDSVTIGLDDDAEGRRNAYALAGELSRLRRDIEVRIGEPREALDVAG